MSIVKPPLIVILGPTACGKSDLGIKLAKKFNGEIINADSRQIYRELDIGTGKVSKAERKTTPHHLLDILKPNQRFSSAQFQKLATKTINGVLKRKKIPFLVGGTGLYIQVVCENLDIPKVKPNRKLRRELEKLGLEELQKEYRNIDPSGYEKIDLNNPRRLIRAIEVVKSTGLPFWQERRKKEPNYRCLKLGLTYPEKILAQRIEKRVGQRLRRGWIMEAKKLLKDKKSEKWLSDFGLGYRQIVLFLKKEISKQELPKLILQEEIKYAKRQMTWFKKDKKIRWLKSGKEAEELVKKFLLS